MENQSNETKTENENESINEPDNHDYKRRLWLGVVIFSLVVIVILIMAAGHVLLGSRRQAFGSQRPGSRGTMHMMGRQLGRGGVRHDSTIGTVTKIDGNNLTVHTNGQDVVVQISNTTSIYKNGTIAKQSDITTSETIIVSGTPDSSGQIAAVTIHIK